MKKFLKIVAFVSGGFLLCVGIIAAVTQTQFFRDRIRVFALDRLSAVLDAYVYLGPIHGNLVTGFSIDSVAIVVADAPLLTAQRLNIQYNLFQIPGKTFSIRRLSFIRPDIRCVKSAAGQWNFNQMVRPNPVADTAGAGAFDWNLDLGRLEIVDGHFTLTDSAGLLRPDHGPVEADFVEYHDFSVHDLNLDLTASLKPKRKTVTIAALSFISDHPDVQLKRLSLKATVTPSGAQVENLLIRTARSDLRLSCALEEVDLLRGLVLEELHDKPVHLKLQAADLDLDEFKRFLLPVAFLHGPLSMDIVASGTFGDLRVDTLDVRYLETELHLRGKLTGLHHPETLALDVRASDCTVRPTDPVMLMPSLHLPDLSGLGVVMFTMEYRGTPLDFTTRFALRSESGMSMESKGFSLSIGGAPTLRYAGDISVRNLDVGAMLGEPALNSRLQAAATIDGEGVSLDRLRGTLTVDIDSSEFRGLVLSQSRLVTSASDRIVRTDGRVSLGSLVATLNASLEDRVAEPDSFSVAGNVSSLNLAEVTRDQKYDSDITMSLNVRGSGLTMNTLSLDGVLDISSSRFGPYKLDTTVAHVALDQRDPSSKILRIESDVADLSLTGVFDLGSLIPLVNVQAENVREALLRQLTFLDSTGVNEKDPRDLATARSELASQDLRFDAVFALEVKRLEPVAVVAGQRTFDGTGSLAGWIRGGLDDLALRAELRTAEFFYGSAESGLLIQDGVVSVEASHVTSKDVLNHLHLVMNLNARQLHLNRTKLDSVSWSFTFDRGASEYSLRGVADGTLRVLLDGAAELSSDTVRFSIKTLDLGYRHLSWMSAPGATMVFSPAGLRVRDLLLRRGEEQVRFDGMLGHGGTLDARVEGEGIDLDAVHDLVSEAESRSGQGTFGGTAAVTMTAGGSLERPEFTASIRGSDLTFRNAPLGQLRGEFSYRDVVLTLSLDLVNKMKGPGGASEVHVTGSLPLNLSILPLEERTSDRPVDLTVIASGFQLGVLDPLLPTFNELSGFLNCNMTVQGTVLHPTYEGTFSVSQSVFLFVPNNIYYTFDGRFQAEGERIRVLDATLGNLPFDARNGMTGEVEITGDFAFRNLRPGDFNLRGTGQLLVVKETTRRSSLSVYGNLFVEIGSGGLHFTGNIENSLLSGVVLVRNSSLIFPPTQATLNDERALSVPVVQYDDTVKALLSHRLSAAERYFGRDSTSGLVGGRDNIMTSSFLDGLRYDLAVETSGGSTEIRMVFNPTSGEELVANINGTFTITEDGKRWFGDLVVDRAYYNFLKRFTAEGRIRFTGDFVNPELDITAKYQGVRSVTDSLSGQRSEKIVVSFIITGTRYQPRVDYGMTIDDIDYATYKGPKSNDVQSDAIQFIVYGSFPLTYAEKGEVPSDVQKRVGFSLLTGATSMVTGALSEFLRNQTGFIKSVEFNYGTGAGKSITESADIRLSGVAWNGYWRYGGTILDDPLNNANFSLLYSFDTILQDPSLRNLMIEFERRVEVTSSGQKSDLKRVNSARLFYRFTF
jgi:hypothetical protein